MHFTFRGLAVSLMFLVLHCINTHCVLRPDLAVNQSPHCLVQNVFDLANLHVCKNVSEQHKNGTLCSVVHHSTLI